MYNDSTCIRKKQTQVAFQIMQLIFVDIKFMFHEIKDYVIRFKTGFSVQLLSVKKHSK